MNKLYTTLVENNANRFHNIYEKTEKLFQNLSRITDNYEVI